MYQEHHYPVGFAANPMYPWFAEENSGQFQWGPGFSGSSERCLDQREHLYLEGSAQSHLFILQSGVIGTYKLLSDGRRQIVGFYYAGDILGLGHPDCYANSAVALSDCTVRSIPTVAIEKLLMTESGFGQSILRMTSMELAEAREQLVSLGRQSAVEKLASFLLRLSRRNRRMGSCPNTLDLPMKRADIGDYLGLTIETISRNMTKLRVAKIIKLLPNSQVRVLDIDALDATADGLSAEI